MRLNIHNVGHGACISLHHENGNVMLWDCGHQGNNRPSTFLVERGIPEIHRFFVTNFDEDHISDLPDLRANLNIQILHRNTSISSEQLRALKLESGPISSAMGSMLDMLGTYTGGVPQAPPEFPGVSFNVYWNEYLTDFEDSNNISLVTILNCRNKKFIIPGDVERAGWLKLIENQSFCDDLRDVDVFVASHHGRENGYCEELFDICSPEVFVFSDSAIVHATQQTASKYAGRASGINFNGETRYVLSTRNDGEFGWNL